MLHFHGAHTPTELEVKIWHAPLAMKMQTDYPVNHEILFRHFEIGMYKNMHSAFDSETQERMVVYQALYGNLSYRVRPVKMFFKNIERDGKRFARFTETDPGI